MPTRACSADPARRTAAPRTSPLCAGDPTAPPEEPAAAPVVVTLRDIASFRPAAPGNGMEPGGWAIEGLPANFVAAASVQVVSGTLLGQPADVRFTPVGYRWTHSDGAVVDSGDARRDVGGARAARVHRDGDEPRLRCVGRVHGRPRGRPAGRVPVRGVAVARRSPARSRVAGAPQRVLVGEFDTVLTQGDCNARTRAGPGC